MCTRFGALLTFSLFFLSCNYAFVDQSTVEKNDLYQLPSEKMSDLSYGFLAQKIFIPKCVSCHGNSGQVNLESYTEVVRHLKKIESSVFDQKSMPKNGFLTQEELAFLWNWIRRGAPEKAVNGHPPEQEKPLLPNFDSIDRRVFQTSCKDCHNSTGTGKRVLLDRESLMNSPLELVLPGNADESGLVIALERKDDKQMPPAKEGFSALKPEVIQIIREWIMNGAN